MGSSGLTRDTRPEVTIPLVGSPVVSGTGVRQDRDVPASSSSKSSGGRATRSPGRRTASRPIGHALPPVWTIAVQPFTHLSALRVHCVKRLSPAPAWDGPASLRPLPNVSAPEISWRQVPYRRPSAFAIWIVPWGIAASEGKVAHRVSATQLWSMRRHGCDCSRDLDERSYFFRPGLFFVAGQPFRIFPAGSIKTGGV
jgi:hypothetical protein